MAELSKALTSKSPGAVPQRADEVIFPDWPFHEADEIAAVTAVLRSGLVNAWTGAQVKSFEKEFRECTGAPYAVAVNSGTSALELACSALGLGQGDEIIVPATGFISDAVVPLMAGSVPVFADVDADTQSLDIASAKDLISPRTRAILVVHLGGIPCEMQAAVALAREHDLLLVEDCAQAHAARYRGQTVGSFGDAAVFSFCTDKIMSTGGEGGMLLLKHEKAWERAWSFKDHGKKLGCLTDARDPGPYKYVHDTLGGNYRMTEMQAAIGRAQLEKLDGWLEIRRDNAVRLRQGLREVPGIRVPDVPDYSEPAWYKAYVFVAPEQLSDGWSRDRIIREINKAGVPCGSGGCPELYREKVIAGRGIAPAKHCPIAKMLGDTSLMFRVDPALGSEQMEKTIRVAGQVMGQATGK